MSVSSQESALVMQLLRDNITLWTGAVSFVVDLGGLNWQYKTIKKPYKTYNMSQHVTTILGIFVTTLIFVRLLFMPFHAFSSICEVSFRVLSFAGHQIPADDSTCFTAVLSLDALASHISEVLTKINEGYYIILHSRIV